jgi:hypothetical protein
MSYPQDWGSILIVAHLFHPVDYLPIKLFCNRDMRHSGGRCSPLPVLLTRRELDHITGLISSMGREKSDGGNNRPKEKINLRVVEDPQNLTSRELRVDWEHGRLW